MPISSQIKTWTAMILDETSRVILFAAGTVLVFGGLAGLVFLLREKDPLLSGKASLRIRESELLKHAPSPPVLPGNGAPRELPAPPGGKPAPPPPPVAPSDDGLVEELYAELLTLRTTVADLSGEVLSLRQSLAERQEGQVERRAA